MKVYVFALAVLVAGVSAGPQEFNEARFIDGIISGVIEDLSQDLQDRGLDPLKREHETFEFRLPVTDLLVVEAYLENLYIKGISNIVINNINFSVLRSRLDFDIALPEISFSLGSSAANVKFFDQDASGSLSGNLKISGIRVHGRVVVRISIIGGVSISSLDINLVLNDIESNLNVVVFGKDISNKVNWILGDHIPNQVYSFSNDINALLEHIIREIVEDLLP